MKLELVRSGQCPSCGAPIHFASNSAAAQVCKSCNFVIARTDRDLRAVGRVADLVPIASPLTVGSTGKLALPQAQGRMFRVAGRMQYDRADAPGAPWQELYLELDGGASWAWLAFAQGNWYWMTLYEHPINLPTYQQAAPGVSLTMGGGHVFAITERSARKPISGEGELPFPFLPGAVEYYADMSGPEGAFGTIDYGTGQTPEPPQVYFGHRIDPRAIQIDGGGPMAEAPKTQVAALKCPGCGGDLPLAEPDRSERVVCRYCGTQSDVNQGALVALKKLPLPPVEPAIALGATGTLRGQQVTMVGFMVRGTEVEDEHFAWREYLLYAGAGGFVFLLEEDGKWQHIVPIGLGDLGRPSDDVRQYQGQPYRWKQSVTAVVESVVGEFYWKVEVGEAVAATEFEGPKHAKISEEHNGQEISCSFSTPISLSELRQAFGNQFALSKASPGAQPNAGIGHHLFWVALLLLWVVVSIGACARAQDKVVFDAELPVKNLKSGISKNIGASVIASLEQSKKNARILPDGTVRTNDMRIGAVTSKPATNVDAALEPLKPRIARCFPPVVTGSFNVVVTMGPKGLAKTSEAKDAVGLAPAQVSCARVVFLAARFPDAPAGAVITIPISFTPVADSSPTTPPTGSPNPAEPDTAAFTDPFEVPLDNRNLRLELSVPNLDNTWVGLEVALVHESTGTVWEDAVEMEYYSGVEGGESWSEGSRSKSLWYSRVPGGKYVLRVDAATDAVKAAQGPIRAKIVSDRPPAGYVIATLVILVSLYGLSTALRKKRLASQAQKPVIVPVNT